MDSQTDLFGHAASASNDSRRETIESGAPLAHRMRPRNIDEFVGQQRVLGSDSPLRRWILSDRIPSILLWGPPGSGKTTLGRVIAEQTQSRFVSLSAVLSGVKDIKAAVAEARSVWGLNKRKTILFVDEIHRFNKSQQDALLPHVENGTLTLIGATTENPSFEINSALLSRCQVVRLDTLSTDDLVEIMGNALKDSERGLARTISFEEDVLDWIAKMADGDARRALTTLEGISFALAQEKDFKSQIAVSLEHAKKVAKLVLERQPLRYDKNSDEHYNIISAFIKSLRDSDPHAGLYYLARMIESGEDPIFIARRLTVFASEDVGNADPNAIRIAIAVKQAVEFIGMPEARINLAQAVTYLAMAPKSNASYMGIENAIKEVRESGTQPVPFHLRNAPTQLMKDEGYGKGYQYAHSQEDQRAKQRHLPEKLIGKRFYIPKDVGLEIKIKEKLDRLNQDFE